MSCAAGGCAGASSAVAVPGIVCPPCTYLTPEQQEEAQEEARKKREARKKAHEERKIRWKKKGKGLFRKAKFGAARKLA